MLLTIFAELSFTLYTDFYGTAFVVGHLFKFLSFWMIYLAIVQTTLAEPFSVMTQGSSSYDAIPYPAIVVDNNGIISQVNRAAEAFSGRSALDLIHQHVHPLFHPDDVLMHDCDLCQAIMQGRPIKDLVVSYSNKQQCFLISLSLINTDDQTAGMVLSLTDVTAQKKSEHALKTQEAWLSQVLNTLPYGVQENDIDGVITYSNAAHHRILGLKTGELTGRNIWDFEVDEKHKQDLKEYLAYVVKEQPDPEPYESVNLCHDGSEVIVEIIWDYQRDNQGKLKGFISVISDVTKRKQAQRALCISEQRFQDFAETAADIFWEMDDNLRFTYVSGKVDKVMGTETNSIVGKNRQELYARQNLIQTPDFKQHLITLDEHKPFSDFEVSWIREDGEQRYLNLSGTPRFDESGKFLGYRGVSHDVTESKLSKDKIIKQAHFDSLTNLPNRFLSLDRLSQLLTDANRNNEKVAVLFLDLDDFKKVNDSLGHETGDHLLIEAAERLRLAVRAGDTVGRLGGDEFIVLLGNLDDANDARPIAENLLYRFKEAFKINGRDLILTASVGIAVYPDDGDNASELLRNADSVMYHSKALGRNTYSYFTDDMNHDVSRRLSLEEQIHGALDRREFSVYYQPQIDISSNKIMGAEALLRWFNPALGHVSPAEFIPVAEQTGVIIPLGQFVLKQVLAKTVFWQKQFDEEFRIAVNLSPRQFRDPDLVSFIQQALLQSSVKNETLELEITEGVLMSGHSYVDDALKSLSDMNVSIGMDDFGTGYSSLSYLRRYPFDVLKIDQSFIRDITEDSADRELINAAIAMAHGLNLKVVAEGVETAEQLSYLKSLHCDYAQGYLLGKPMTDSELSEKLKIDSTESD